MTPTYICPTLFLQSERQVITRQEWMVLLVLKDSRNFRKVYLYPALAVGLVEMTIPNNRHLQYRLTALGEAKMK